jgi:hypothetical protein
MYGTDRKPTRIVPWLRAVMSASLQRSYKRKSPLTPLRASNRISQQVSKRVPIAVVNSGAVQLLLTEKPKASAGGVRQRALCLSSVLPKMR